MRRQAARRRIWSGEIGFASDPADGGGHLGSAASPSQSVSSAAICLATSGAGPSVRRTALGSERISASTFSATRPGTSHASRSSVTWASPSRGTVSVMPSRSAPGSKR